MRFRKRIEEIEAEQWQPGKQVQGVCGDDSNKLCGCALIGGDKGSVPHVHPTKLDYGVRLRPGDWVIREADGMCWPCPPDEFAQLFEPIPEE